MDIFFGNSSCFKPYPHEKIQLYLILTVFLPFVSFSQTWNGTTSSDWNTASNWSPNTVPSSSSVITINQVIAPAFTPKLSADVSVASIYMSPGSELDVNGHTITTSNYFQTNGTVADSILITNSTPANNDIVINMNGTTANYLRGTEFNGKVNVNTNTMNSFTIGYGTNICTFNDAVAIQSSGTGTINISTNSTNIFNGDLSIDMLAAAPLSLFTTADTSKVLGNFQLTNLIGGNMAIGHTSKMTTITGTINIHYDAPGLNNSFFLYCMKNLTAGGKVFIQNPGQYTTISTDTLLVDTFSLTNYNSTTSSYRLAIGYNSISGNTIISDAPTNKGELRLGGNLINGDYNIINNGDVAVNESYYGASTIGGNALLIKNGTGFFIANSTGISSILGNYTFECNDAGEVQLFINGITSVEGNFSYTDEVGAKTQIGNLTNTTTISGKIDIDYNGNNLHNQFLLYKIKNLTNGGNINIQNTGLTTTISSDTLIVNQFSLTNYNSLTGSYGLYFGYNSISGNTVISDTSTNNGEMRFGGSFIDGDFSVLNNGNIPVNETYYGPNTITGNVLYTKNGSGNFLGSSNGNSAITGNYTFLCHNPSGLVQLFIGGASTIQGNFIYNDSFGVKTQLGNTTNQTIISGKVDVYYNSDTLNNDFLMYQLKNETGGGSVDIQSPGKTTNIYRDTLMVDHFSISNYNQPSNSYYLFFQYNSISGNTTISDSTANNRPVKTGGNNIGGNYTIETNGSSYFTEAEFGGNTIGGNVLYIKNGSGDFTTSSNTTSNIQGNYEFQCNNAQGLVQLFIHGTTSIGGNFKLVDTVGADISLGNTTNQTVISGKVDIDYNSKFYNAPFTMFNLKNTVGGGNVKIQHPSRTTNIQQNTLIADNFSVLNYNTVSGSYYFHFFNNSISGNTTISDSTTNNRPVIMGGNNIGGNYTIKTNGSANFGEAEYGGNTVGGNVLYIKNGSGDFTTSSNTTSNINGNYDFHCNNAQGLVQLFIQGVTTIGGNFNLVDTLGANIFLGNLTTQTLISGKVDIDYNSKAYNLPFTMYRLKNLAGGGKIMIQNPGRTTNIHQDTLIVDNFSILNYNTVSGSYYLYFNYNSISGNTKISDSTTNTRKVSMGGNEIGGDYTIISNGPPEFNPKP